MTCTGILLPRVPFIEIGGGCQYLDGASGRRRLTAEYHHRAATVVSTDVVYVITEHWTKSHVVQYIGGSRVRALVSRLTKNEGIYTRALNDGLMLYPARRSQPLRPPTSPAMGRAYWPDSSSMASS